MTNLWQATKVGYTHCYRTFRTPYWRIPIGVVVAYLWFLYAAFWWGFWLVFVGVYWALLPSAVMTFGLPVLIGYVRAHGESENQSQTDASGAND